MPEKDAPIRFYGRRRGRPLRDRHRTLTETLLPQLRINLPAHGGTLDPATLFNRECAAIWLEIGFGGGEHLAAQAAAHPDVGLIGAEVFLNGIAKLLAAVDDGGLRNVRLWPEDARLLLDALPDASIDRLFLLFPDPWPKTRHEDRRFLVPENLLRLARVLKDGGEFRLASDHPVYQRWMLQQMDRAADFRLTRNAPDTWPVRPADWPETRYEAKARREGRTPFFLIYERLPRD